MPGRDTDSTADENPVLSPFFPSESPSIPGSGRTRFALLVTVLLLLGAVFGALELLLGLYRSDRRQIPASFETRP